MTVGDLRDILMAEWLPDDIIIMDYEENLIRDVNLVINKDGAVTEVRLGMEKA